MAAALYEAHWLVVQGRVGREVCGVEAGMGHAYEGSCELYKPGCCWVSALETRCSLSIRRPSPLGLERALLEVNWNT